MLSRGMIFNSLSIFYSTFKFSKRLSISIDFKFILKLFFVLIILFYISVIIVNKVRSEYFYKGFQLLKLIKNYYQQKNNKNNLII